MSPFLKNPVWSFDLIFSSIISPCPHFQIKRQRDAYSCANARFGSWKKRHWERRFFFFCYRRLCQSRLSGGGKKKKIGGKVPRLLPRQFICDLNSLRALWLVISHRCSAQRPRASVSNSVKCCRFFFLTERRRLAGKDSLLRKKKPADTSRPLTTSHLKVWECSGIVRAGSVWR